MANTLAWIFGVVLLLVGVLGFVPGMTTDGYLLGIFQVDPLHNIIHLLTGAVAVLAALGMGVSTGTFFKVFGVVYAVVAVVGFMQGDTVLGLIATNMADHVLHLILAVVFLYAGFGMKDAGSQTMM